MPVPERLERYPVHRVPILLIQLPEHGPISPLFRSHKPIGSGRSPFLEQVHSGDYT